MRVISTKLTVPEYHHLPGIILQVFTGKAPVAGVRAAVDARFISEWVLQDPGNSWKCGDGRDLPRMCPE